MLHCIWAVIMALPSHFRKTFSFLILHLPSSRFWHHWSPQYHVVAPQLNASLHFHCCIHLPTVLSEYISNHGGQIRIRLCDISTTLLSGIEVWYYNRSVVLCHKSTSRVPGGWKPTPGTLSSLHCTDEVHTYITNHAKYVPIHTSHSATC